MTDQLFSQLTSLADISEPTVWSGRSKCFKYARLPLSANTSALLQYI